MKKLPSVEHVETLSLPAMRRLVADLVKLSPEHEAEFEKLRLINERLRLENEQLTLKHERLHWRVTCCGLRTSSCGTRLPG